MWIDRPTQIWGRQLSRTNGIHSLYNTASTSSVCVYVCLWVYEYVNSSAWECVRVHVREYVCEFLCVSVCECMCVTVCECVWAYKCECMCVSVCEWVYECVSAYVGLYRDEQTQFSAPLWRINNEAPPVEKKNLRTYSLMFSHVLLFYFPADVDE